jgi:hypothetical protein
VAGNFCGSNPAEALFGDVKITLNANLSQNLSHLSSSVNKKGARVLWLLEFIGARKFMSVLNVKRELQKRI